jgi:methyltransferase (TIGR00027 family)
MSLVRLLGHAVRIARLCLVRYDDNMTRKDMSAVAGLGAISETALWTAAARARESARNDRLFNDPFAAVLAGPAGFRLLKRFHTPNSPDGGNPFLPVRTRWFDDYLARCMAFGLRQVIALGAGLDTRAFRLDWPDGTVVYEVDQSDVQNYKRHRLGGVDAVPRCIRRTIDTDLAGDWASELLAAGYDPSVPSVWFGEGLLYYLPEQVARTLLKRVAELSAPGSQIAVDLIGPGIFRFPYTRQFLGELEAAGSPWLFGTDDPSAFVSSCGWHVEVATEPGCPGADFGRWPGAAAPANVPNLPRSFLVAAELAT